MRVTHYQIIAPLKSSHVIALAADLHEKPHDAVIEALSHEKPDCIAVPGDLLSGSVATSEISCEFLRLAASIAPTFYSPGNHEKRFSARDEAAIRNAGAVPLDDAWTELDGIRIGGLRSGYTGRRLSAMQSTPAPSLAWLHQFSELDGYKILLCHHPEYYVPYIRNTTIDLILSGHAHGGQIRLFGRGLYAPGQGIFPKYTSGVFENRLVVSRGLANTAPLIPRVLNPTELVILHLSPVEDR